MEPRSRLGPSASDAAFREHFLEMQTSCVSLCLSAALLCLWIYQRHVKRQYNAQALGQVQQTCPARILIELTGVWLDDEEEEDEDLITNGVKLRS